MFISKISLNMKQKTGNSITQFIAFTYTIYAYYNIYAYFPNNLSFTLFFKS